MSAFHNPTVALCRLYRCTSKTGSTYFRGRLGAARVVLLKDRETAEDGSEIWNLLVQESGWATLRLRQASRAAGEGERRPSNGANGSR
jgi:hypothetical protein